MSDQAVRDLARRAGVAVEWINYENETQSVSVEVLRHVLAALGLPCDSQDDIEQSSRDLDARARRLPKLVTATTGEPIRFPLGDARSAACVRVVREDGTTDELTVRHARNGDAILPPMREQGYHSLHLGEHSITLAVAPRRCYTVGDAGRASPLWGLGVQVYGLRREDDCGIGDTGGVAALAVSAAQYSADALALSPTHAMFTADPAHFSPYSPSSRLFYNPLHADGRVLFGEARVAKVIRESGLIDEMRKLERQREIDWPTAAEIKLKLFRALFEDFSSRELGSDAASGLATDFARFQGANGDLLYGHALFEALHAARLSDDPAKWHWLGWLPEWRDPRSAAVQDFALGNAREILFHCFLQWITERSLAAAQARARQAGMRIGLISDLAVGMSSGGSHAWALQSDVLAGLSIGAPPDAFNPHGQNWGLTTFSPHSLRVDGFAPFIATLRAAMRNSGGVRIDHVMGLMRLWVIPDQAKQTEGTYLAYPFADLMRLTALESQRHRAIVVGEDLGTVPPGFRARLARSGIAGMRVLWFERRKGRFLPPEAWSREAVATTSTHDLPTVAGWWRGIDITARERSGQLRDAAPEYERRKMDRKALWSAFSAAGAGTGPVPSSTDADQVADSAVRFLARTPSSLVMIPLEDALGLEDQPNLPGTIHEHPNWRRRYPADAATLLDGAAVRARLKPLKARKGSS